MKHKKKPEKLARRIEGYEKTVESFRQAGKFEISKGYRKPGSINK